MIRPGKRIIEYLLAHAAVLRDFWWCWLLIAAALLLNHLPWLGAP